MPLLLLSFSLMLISRNLKNYRSKSSNWHAVHGFAFVIIRLNIKSPMLSRNINEFPREPVLYWWPRALVETQILCHTAQVHNHPEPVSHKL